MTLSTTRARALTIAGVGIASVLVIGGTATAASQITAHDLATGAANHRVIKDGSIHQSDLTDGVDALLHQAGPAGPQGNQGPAGPTGSQGPRGPQGVLAAQSVTLSPTVVADIGGSWKSGHDGVGQGHTKVGTLNLAAGTYLISVNADFTKVAGAADGASPSLQIQLNDGPAVDAFPATTYLTAYTGAFPASPSEALNRVEQTASGSNVITLSHATTVEVDAFGYNADQSGAGSGDFQVVPTVSYVQVNPDVAAASTN